MLSIPKKHRHIKKEIKYDEGIEFPLKLELKLMQYLM